MEGARTSVGADLTGPAAIPSLDHWSTLRSESDTDGDVYAIIVAVGEKATVDQAELARLFKVSSLAARRLVRQRGFPASKPDGQRYVAELFRWAASQDDPRLARIAPIGYQRPADRPADFVGAWPGRGGRAEDYQVLCWDTWLGVVAVGWTTGIGWPTRLEVVVDASPADAYVVVAVTGFSNQNLGEKLPALDTHYPGSVVDELGISQSLRSTQTTQARWADLAQLLGQPVPFWPTAVRRLVDLNAWQPGSPVEVVVPATADMDIDALVRVAALEDGDTSVRRTLQDLAVVVEARSIRSCQRQVAEIEDFGRPDVVYAAAVPPTGPVRMDPDPTISEAERRAAWLELFSRRDQLASACLQAGDVLNGSQHFPFMELQRFTASDIASSRERNSALAEWWDRLREITPTAGHFYLRDETRLRRTQTQFLVDPETDAPVVVFGQDQLSRRRGDHDVLTLLPARLPVTEPLAEVVLDRIPWVRVDDGTLYPMPTEPPYSPLTWGYGGGGPSATAATIAALLDDPTAYGTREGGSNGLLDLVEINHPHGTVLTRQQLEEARARPWAGP